MTGTAHDGSPGLPMPDARAPHSDWLAYAVSQGMPEDMARGLTRDQIRVHLGAGSAPLGGEPSLDVLERDPETRDAPAPGQLARLAAAVTGRRKAAAHPLEAMDAAKAAVAAKAERAPEKLTAEDLKLLRGAKILELGNAGHLRHLGLGLPLPKSSARAAAPKGRTAGSARALLTDADLEKMSGGAISKAMAAGQVAGIAPRKGSRRR